MGRATTFDRAFRVRLHNRTAASLVGVNKNNAASYFHRLREIIAQESEDTSPLFGDIEVDESYFGGHRKASADEVPAVRFLCLAC